MDTFWLTLFYPPHEASVQGTQADAKLDSSIEFYISTASFYPKASKGMAGIHTLLQKERSKPAVEESPRALGN